MHRSGSGFEKILYLKKKGWIRLFKGESGSACFGTKMAPCLWRADLSFRNSVTGSGSRAKCSNILQDKYVFMSFCVSSAITPLY